MSDVENIHWIDILALREDLWISPQRHREHRGVSFFIRSGDDDQIKDQSAYGGRSWDNRPFFIPSVLEDTGIEKSNPPRDETNFQMRWDMLLGLARKKTSLCVLRASVVRPKK
jgi:hypothetical protein